jgi:hypothetical protein
MIAAEEITEYLARYLRRVEIYNNNRPPSSQSIVPGALASGESPDEKTVFLFLGLTTGDKDER